MTNIVNISTNLGADAKVVSDAVATRIKAYRKAQKLSLDELTQRTGVSKGMLVEIEKGTTNPSIVTLCKLAAAMSVSVADIVSVACEPQPLVHLIEPHNFTTYWNGNKGGTDRLLAGTTGPTKVELWQFVMHPGEQIESSSHSEGTTELLHVQQGQLTLTVAQSELVVPAGCAAVAKTDVPHCYANRGEERLMFTVVVAESITA